MHCAAQGVLPFTSKLAESQTAALVERIKQVRRLWYLLWWSSLTMSPPIPLLILADESQP